MESGEAGERGNSRSKGPEAEVGAWGVVVAVAREEAWGEHRAEQIMLGPLRTWEGSSG